MNDTRGFGNSDIPLLVKGAGKRDVGLESLLDVLYF